jgi:nitrate/nitrite transporter NarK
MLAAPPDPRRVRVERDLDVPAGMLRDRRLYRLAVLYGASLGLSLVVGNWVVELLERNAGVAKGTAGAVGAFTLLLGVLTRPLGGWILRERPAVIRASVAGALAAGAVGTALLAISEPLWIAAIGSVLIGLAAGIPFAPAFTGAALVRPDAPAAAVGMVNGAASLVVICGTPLLGLTFRLPGDGRIGFVLVAVLWLVALVLLPTERDMGVRTS